MAYYHINSGQAPSAWHIAGGFTITPYNNNISAEVTASGPDQHGAVIAILNGVPYTISISSCNEDVYGKSVSAPKTYVSVYPNPVSSILTVEIDEVTAAQIRESFPNASNVEVAPIYDIQLYSTTGLVRSTQTKGNQVTFDVSNLPSGFYFLHVNDGIIPYPEVHKVMVN